MKNFEKYFMTHQYMPKTFNDPHKTPPASQPTYLMYALLLLQLFNSFEYMSSLSSGFLGFYIFALSRICICILLLLPDLHAICRLIGSPHRQFLTR